MRPRWLKVLLWSFGAGVRCKGSMYTPLFDPALGLPRGSWAGFLGLSRPVWPDVRRTSDATLDSNAYMRVKVVFQEPDQHYPFHGNLVHPG